MKSISSIVIIISLLITSHFYGQVSNANWKSHFAYLDFVDIAVSDENVYVAALNSIFVHNIFTNSNEEYTTVDGLSGDDISAIHYNADLSQVIIGYQNGLVELVNENTGNVTTLVDISTQSDYPQANIKVNNFFQDGDVLYIATGFGIVQYNLASGFFGDTFLISDSLAVVSDVLAVGISGDNILASISGRGTFLGDKTNTNLITESNWSNIQADVFIDMQLLGDQLIAHAKTTNIYEYVNDSFSIVYTSANNLISFQTNSSNELTLTYASGSLVLDSNYNALNDFEHGDNVELNSNIIQSVFLDNEIYFSNSGIGFYKTTNSNFETIEKISPDGPLENDAFSLDAYDGDLWISYGETSRFFGVSDEVKGLNRFREGNWLSIPYEDFNATTITRVTINKNDKNNVLFSSYGEGLLVYSDDEFNLYTAFNSNLESDILETLGEDEVKVFDAIYDDRGDIWVLNNRTANGIKRFSSSNDGEEINLEAILPVPRERTIDLNFWDIAINDSQNIFVGSYNSGLIAYNTTTDQLVDLLGEEEYNIPSTTIRNVEMDLNGELWLGTNEGVRKYSNPDGVFVAGESQVAESIIFLEDGIAQELLSGLLITDIEVDASNNKWISTADSGVFYVSSDGQETIYNFTESNSPIPSNEVNDIAIDESSGAVYFATTKGLMEFNSNVTSASEDLTTLKVFPNPVRPEYENATVTIQGLTSGANVKITDIEGNLVYETQNETFGSGGSGSVLWDTRAFSGNKVSSGVYLILITDQEGVETSIQKLLIVR